MKNMSDFEEVVSEVENSKDQIEKIIINIKDNIKSALDDFNLQRKVLIKAEKAKLLENPGVVLVEFFFVGFYAAKMINLLHEQKKARTGGPRV